MDNKKEETPLETFQRIDRATEERHRNHLSMMSQHSMLPQPKFDKLEVRDYNLEEMQEQTEIQKEALGEQKRQSEIMDRWAAMMEKQTEILDRQQEGNEQSKLIQKEEKLIQMQEKWIQEMKNERAAKINYVSVAITIFLASTQTVFAYLSYNPQPKPPAQIEKTTSAQEFLNLFQTTKTK